MQDTNGKLESDVVFIEERFYVGLVTDRVLTTFGDTWPKAR